MTLTLYLTYFKEIRKQIINTSVDRFAVYPSCAIVVKKKFFENFIYKFFCEIFLDPLEESRPSTLNIFSFHSHDATTHPSRDIVKQTFLATRAL